MNDLTDLTLKFNLDAGSAIKMFSEAVHEFEISVQEVSLAALRDPILTESADVLYEDAAQAVQKKGKNAIARFFISIGEFIKGIALKIASFFKRKKTDEAIADVKKNLSNAPEASSEKVEVFDLAKMNDLQVKHFKEVQALLIKSNSGDELNADELEKIDKFYKSEFEDLQEEKVEVTVDKAIAEANKAVEIAKKSTEALQEMAKKVKDKTEETLAKVSISGNDAAIQMCTKQMAELQKTITKLSEERMRILAPIEKNIATIKAAIKSAEVKIATNKTDAKYGSNVFKKIGGNIRSNRQNTKLTANTEKMKTQLKGLKDDVKSINTAYDAKIADATSTYDKYQSKVDSLVKNVDKIASK